LPTIPRSLPPRNSARTSPTECATFLPISKKGRDIFCFLAKSAPTPGGRENHNCMTVPHFLRLNQIPLVWARTSGMALSWTGFASSTRLPEPSTPTSSVSRSPQPSRPASMSAVGSSKQQGYRSGNAILLRSATTAGPERVIPLRQKHPPLRGADVLTAYPRELRSLGPGIDVLLKERRKMTKTGTSPMMSCLLTVLF